MFTVPMTETVQSEHILIWKATISHGGYLL